MLMPDFSCPKCGGTLLGDGYTSVVACEFADIPEGTEADADIVLCDYEEMMFKHSKKEISNGRR